MKQVIQGIRGSLEQHSLPDVMRRIYMERRTGELLLSRDAMRRRVFFETGRAVFAASNRKRDRLGEFLLRRGDITQEVFDMLSNLVPQGRRFGQLLVEMGILSQEQMLNAVHEQVLSLICSLFEWTKGDFEFIDRATPNVPADLKLELSMADIMLEGVGRIRDVTVVRRGMGDLNRLIGPQPDPLLRMQQASLKPQERALLSQIVEPTDLLAIMVFSQLGAADTIRSLYGLLSAGFLTWVAPQSEDVQPVVMVLDDLSPQAVAVGRAISVEPEAAPLPIDDSAPSVAAESAAADDLAADGIISAQPAQKQEEDLWREIGEVRNRIGSGDPYAVFGLARQASLAQLRAAYYELLRHYHPDKFRQAPRKLREEIEEVFKQINMAWNVVQREAQQRASDPASYPSTTAAAIAQQPDQSRAAWADVGQGEVMQETAKITQQELHRAAELAYRTGISALLAKNYSEAVEQLTKAVNIDPRNPRYHSMAGFAMYSNSPRSNPRICRDAEQHFLEAIRLEPQDAYHHALLGLLYARLGMIRRAEAVYQQALRIDPRNEIAINGLAARPIGFEMLLHVVMRS